MDPADAVAMVICPIHEVNPCHNPACGAGCGGRFCSSSAGKGGMNLVGRLTPGSTLHAVRGSVGDVEALHRAGVEALTADKNVMALLTKVGIRFALTDGSYTDVPGNAHMKGKRPRGWTYGSWDKVGGGYSRSMRLVVAGNPALLGSSAGSVLAHETGHGVDMALRQADPQWLMKTLYRPWLAMVREQKPSPYFRQRKLEDGAPAGLGETWAESFSIYVHHGVGAVGRKFGVRWARQFHRVLQGVFTVSAALRPVRPGPGRGVL